MFTLFFIPCFSFLPFLFPCKHHALDEDHRLTRVDAVKKRAVRTVGSYEEFKNLVACAHLRPLSRKDIQSVAQRTQGWTTTSSSAGGKINVKGKERKGGDSDALSAQQYVNRKGTTNATKAMPGTNNPPSSSASSSSSSSSTPLAFERECQQLVKSGKSSQEKLSLLRSVGGASFIHRCYIMGKKKREMNADVLGDFLMVLLGGLKTAKGEGETEERGEKKDYADQEEEEDISADATMDALNLLHALIQIDRFQITLALLSRFQLEAAREIVEKLESEGKVEEEGKMHRLEEVHRAFSCSAGGEGRKPEEVR